MSIIYPVHYRIVEHRSGCWFIKHPEPFYGDASRCDEDIYSVYGITKEQLLINLFRINGGRNGFYLVNLKRHQFYYCGEQWEDVRSQLIKLGIGRTEPN